MALEQASATRAPAGAAPAFTIVLQPIAHPELGDIRIDDELFAVGRTEPPFAGYAPEFVAELSRRHARLFSEFGAVYVADLGSKNGTTLNGTPVREKPARLRDGDEIGFGRELSYRVQLGARAQMPGKAARLVSLTLEPERSDLGLEPIVVSRFPFLISKSDETFARYKDAYPHQVNYLSRRHAHLFLKGGSPYVEDLGSTNGSFVGGQRLDEHAVALHDGDEIAFGGHHFVYRVRLQQEMREVDPTLTQLAAASATSAVPEAADKTTFVAAADSFLDIFCVDQGPADESADPVATPDEEVAAAAAPRRKRGKLALFAAELRSALSAGERRRPQRLLWWALALAGGLGTLAALLFFKGADEREVQALLASGQYAKAAAIAGRRLAEDPDDAELKALDTEARLKANVPNWLALVQARDFDRAEALLASMRKDAGRNTEVQALAGELEWVGELERFTASRGGIEAPIRVFVDEEKIRALLKRWDEDAQGHQRALARIASYVPQFQAPYAESLSHLRKLQSDDAVYLAASDRLQTSITEALKRDQPESLEAVLGEYAQKYPRLGLDAVRQDLRQDLAIESALRARNLGPLIPLLAKARFATPPFQARFQALAASGRLPPAEAVQQYEAAIKAWREGDLKQAAAGLQGMAAGPWREAASAESERQRSVVDRIAALQKARADKGYDERLLALYASLDPERDAFFMRTIETDLGLDKDKALRSAQELLNRAQARWREYRDKGAIDRELRAETMVSNRFRAQSRLLAEARGAVRQGLRVLSRLQPDSNADWRRLGEEIEAEAEMQQRSLRELQAALEPGILQAKLALLGASGGGGEER